MDYCTLRLFLFPHILDSVWDEEKHQRDKVGRFSRAHGVTQGLVWRLGQRKGLFSHAPIPAPSITGKELGKDILEVRKGAKAKLDTLYKRHPEGVINRDTGWKLVMTGDDRKKIARWEGTQLAALQAVAKIEEIINNAVLAESFHDNKHNNPDVQAIHTLYAPVEINGKLHAVKLTVRDYAGGNVADRTGIRFISTLEIENAPLGNLRRLGGDDLPATARPTTERTVTIAQLLKTARRENGKPFAVR